MEPSTSSPKGIGSCSAGSGPTKLAADLAPEEVAAIERLIAERTQARKEKNWPRADEIRAELDAFGVQVTDTPAGPTWQLR